MLFVIMLLYLCFLGIQSLSHQRITVFNAFQNNLSASSWIHGTVSEHNLHTKVLHVVSLTTIDHAQIQTVKFCTSNTATMWLGSKKH